MAEIDIEVVNLSGQTVRLRVEEDGEQHQYLKTLLRRDDLRSITSVQTSEEPPQQEDGRPALQTPGSEGPDEAAVERPAVNAPKTDWIDHVFQRRLLSREDAANLTKADLIDLASS